MALVRILVDGYSLLHCWTALAPGQPRHSAAAREALVSVLTSYRDACGTPITIVFDGSGPRRDPAETRSTPEVEVLYSREGQSADQVIERVAHRLQPYGEPLVVTDDLAERDLVISLGGMASSCENFIQTVASALKDLERDVKNYNLRERDRYRKE
ncbi:MAG TPA: NYN domain-containing protein [Verrucomicrobiae bacterium]|nr:NYN domain-containing protein [Verrucomicrobiae bacterium]